MLVAPTYDVIIVQLCPPKWFLMLPIKICYDCSRLTMQSLLSTLDGRVLGLGALFDMIDREVSKLFANMPGSEKKVLRVEGGLVKTS